MQKHTVEFNQVAMANSEGSEVMLNRVMTKDNIGVAILLEIHKDTFSGGKKTEKVNESKKNPACPDNRRLLFVYKYFLPSASEMFLLVFVLRYKDSTRPPAPPGCQRSYALGP